MKAHPIIDSAPFDADEQKVIGWAFDEAWASIAESFTENTAKCARTKLARAVLLAANHSRDPAVLKEVGLRIMKGYYSIL